MNFRRL